MRPMTSSSLLGPSQLDSTRGGVTPVSDCWGWRAGAGKCEVQCHLGVSGMCMRNPIVSKVGQGVLVYTQPVTPSSSSEAGVALGLWPGWRQYLLRHAQSAPGGLGLGRLSRRAGAPRGAQAQRVRRPLPTSRHAGKAGASALLPIFPVSVLYCFLLLKLTCLIGNWCRIVSRGLLWNISTAVSFN